MAGGARGAGEGVVVSQILKNQSLNFQILQILVAFVRSWLNAKNTAVASRDFPCFVRKSPAGMSKIITWFTDAYSDSRAAYETDSLFYAENVVRYLPFTATYSLKCSLAETLHYTRSGQPVVVPPGGMLVTSRGTEMECLPSRPGGKILFVYFTDKLVQDVYRNQQCSDAALLDDPTAESAPIHFFEHLYQHSNGLSNHLQNLSRQMTAAGSPERQLPPDLFYDLAAGVLSLQRQDVQRIARIDARNRATREELYRRLLQAQAFMRDHWRERPTLSDIAGRACLSPFHFHRSFREAFGQSPAQWLRQLRLEKAGELLLTGQWTVTEVALHCGFADTASFSKAFHGVWGVRPSAYRKGSRPVVSTARTTQSAVG